MAQRAPGAGGTHAPGISGGRVVLMRQEPGIATPIIDQMRARVPGWFGIGSRSIGFYRPSLSVGDRTVPVVGESVGVSKQSGPSVNAATTTGITSSGQIDRRDTAQNKSELPNVEMKHVNDWFEFHELAGQGKPVKHWPTQRMANVKGPGVITPGIAETAPSSTTVLAPKVPVATATKQNTGKQPMDLGGIITDLGKTYIQTKYAPGPTTTQQPVYNAFDFGSDVVDYFTDPSTGTVVPVKKKKP